MNVIVKEDTECTSIITNQKMTMIVVKITTEKLTCTVQKVWKTRVMIREKKMLKQKSNQLKLCALMLLFLTILLVCLLIKIFNNFISVLASFAARWKLEACKIAAYSVTEQLLKILGVAYAKIKLHDTNNKEYNFLTVHSFYVVADLSLDVLLDFLATTQGSHIIWYEAVAIAR